jgi:hypothetical protein
MVDAQTIERRGAAAKVADDATAYQMS